MKQNKCDIIIFYVPLFVCTNSMYFCRTEKIFPPNVFPLSLLLMLSHFFFTHIFQTSKSIVSVVQFVVEQKLIFKNRKECINTRVLIEYGLYIFLFFLFFSYTQAKLYRNMHNGRVRQYISNLHGIFWVFYSVFTLFRTITSRSTLLYFYTCRGVYTRKPHSSLEV